jgi:cytoskeletal protein CcmA (bactofilin family)
VIVLERGTDSETQTTVIASADGRVLRLIRDSIYAREISIDIAGVRIIDRNGEEFLLPPTAEILGLPGGGITTSHGTDIDVVVGPGGELIRIESGDHHDQMTQLANDIEILADETFEGDVICIFCDIDVQGFVTGSAVSVFGNVNVDGKTGSEAVAPFGRVRVGPDGQVMGDVSASKIVRDPGGRIDGSRNELFLNIFGGEDGLSESWSRTTFTIIVSLKILFWLFLVLLAHALAARNITKVKERIQRSYVKSFLVGVLGQILLLPAFLLLLITIIGIPVALFVLPLMLFGGFVLAQAAVGQLVGDKIAENTSLPLRTPLAKTIGGVAATQIFAYLTIIFIWPAGHGSSGGAFRLVTLIMFILSAIVGYVVITLGSGAVILTRFGTRPKELLATSDTPPIPDLPIPPDPAVTPLPFEPRKSPDPGASPLTG